MWRDCRLKIRQSFKGGERAEGEFKNTGLHVVQRLGYGIELSQETCAHEMEPISIHPGRRNQSEMPMTESEKSQARGTLGGIGWKAIMSGPQFAAEHGLLTSQVSQGTVQTLLEINKLLA